jgi:hypothetical protein
MVKVPDFGADDAEKSAVATIIARPGSFAHFASLTAEDFHLAPYRAAFEAVLSLVLQGVTPTLVTLSDELKAVAPEAAIALGPGLAYLEEDACPDGQEFALVEILTRYTACRNVAMYVPELKAAADQGIVPVDLIDAMVQVAQTTTGRRPRHQVDELICDAERRFRLLRSDEGDPYALPLDGTGIVRPLKGKNGLRQEMMLAYGLRRGTQPREGALSSATAYLEAVAETMAPEPVALRYALRKDERGEIDRVITDLGTGRFVEITTEGWRVVTMTNAIFRRSSVMLPLPDPVHGGSFDPLWKLINVDVAERDLLLAWMISVIFPGIPCPLLLVRGGQGSAKSTLARTLVMLLDPSVAELRPAPERTDDWQVVTRPNRLVAFDNLRYFPRWLSDALSTAITGTAQVSRTLYTNKEIEATKIMLAVIATGIGVTPELPDLAERTLSLDLGKPPRRREEAKIMADLERHRPEILGAFYDLASAVIGAREAVEPKEHRMADFIRTVAAVDKINSGHAEKAFLARQSSLAEDAIDASPVACAVQSLVMAARNGRWQGSTGELRDRLDSKAKNKGRPGPLGSAQALRSELERLAPALEMVGILFSRAPRTERKREIVLRYDLSFDTRNQELASSGLSTNKTAGQEPIPDANDDPDDPDDLCGPISVNHSSEKDIPAGGGFPGPASRRSSRTDRQDRQIVIGPLQIAGQGANQSMTMHSLASPQLQQAAPTSPIDPPVDATEASERASEADYERGRLTAALITTGLWEWADDRGYFDLDPWPPALETVIRRKVIATEGADLLTNDLEPEQITTDDLEAPGSVPVAPAQVLEVVSVPNRTTKASEIGNGALRWRSWDRWAGNGERITAWCDPWTGRGVTEAGETFHAGPTRRRKSGITLAELLNALPSGVLRCYLTGKRPGGLDPDDARAWWTTTLPAGWAANGHYLKDASAPVGRFVDLADRPVNFYRAAKAWNIGEHVSPDDAAAITAEVARAIRRQFGQFKGMDAKHTATMDTAATTGKALTTLALPPGLEVPELTDEIQELIRWTAGQGRIQLLHPADEIAGLVPYDGRFMYGALTRETPVGPAELVKCSDFEPYARARWHVRVTVPQGWDHLGLLGVKNDDLEDGWGYPSGPGEHFTTWADGAEVHLAQQMGWGLEVFEAIRFAGKADVLTPMVKRIIKAREEVTARATRSEITAAVADGARGCLRAVVLFGIGSFVGLPGMVSKSEPDFAKVPVGVAPREVAGLWWWEEEGSPPKAGMSHPEIPAAIWARCRARLLKSPPVQGVPTGALTLPLAEVVAIRTDCLYLQHDPGWPDDGEAGRFVLKGEPIPGPLPCPMTVDELLTLRKDRRD